MCACVCLCVDAPFVEVNQVLWGSSNLSFCICLLCLGKHVCPHHIHTHIHTPLPQLFPHACVRLCLFSSEAPQPISFNYCLWLPTPPPHTHPIHHHHHHPFPPLPKSPPSVAASSHSASLCLSPLSLPFSPPASDLRSVRCSRSESRGNKESGWSRTGIYRCFHNPCSLYRIKPRAAEITEAPHRLAGFFKWQALMLGLWKSLERGVIALCVLVCV